MAKATFKKIVIMTIPGTITSAALLKSLQDLISEVKGANVAGVLVDVTSLSKSQTRLKAIGAATGPPARETIDPALYREKVKKIAFVESSGNFHGREPGRLPLLRRGSPTKNYFKDHISALKWLRS
jgi:hypothetical protein